MSTSPTTCLVCAGTDVELFLDLGETTLANKFLDESELAAGGEPSFPLRVGFCHTCRHVQLMEIVPPAAMFEDYLYISGASDTLRAHLDELAKVMVDRHSLGADDLVIDIGSNDSSLLESFHQYGTRTLGVDPAKNLTQFAEQKGIDRYTGFFGYDTAGEIVEKWGQASLVTATNTFPHIPALADFVSGIDRVLVPGGRFVIEAHYLADILDQGAYDTVYHEHVSYWALGPMIELFGRHGMEVTRVERLPIHHGQLRATVMRKGEGTVDSSVVELLAAEKAAGFDDLATFSRFADHVAASKRELLATMADLNEQGKTVAAYGAPAKGNTLLSYLELGPESVMYIADRSALKQGRYTPGTHIPVVGPEKLLEDQPAYVLLLAWNFEDEVLAQQAEYRERGGKFIVPVPNVRIV
jgi:predicted TPR repeat methyltransferase